MVKMRKRKKKQYLIIGIILLAIIITIIGIGIYNSAQGNVSYYYDKELGLIKIETNVKGFFSNLFSIVSQAVTFAQTEAEVGDTISLTDNHVITKYSNTLGCAVNDINIHIIGPSGTADIPILLNEPLYNGDIIGKSATLKVLSVGTYSATTTYYERQCNSNGCIASSNCPNSWTESSKNQVEVSAVDPPGCTLVPNEGTWVFSSDISNGEITKRTPQIVNSDCEYEDGTTEYQTSCDSGYQITGTDGNTVGSGQLTCEIIPIPNECDSDSDCTAQRCVNNNCVNYECETGVIINKTCSDNSTVIIDKTCVNNVFVPSNATCPEDPKNKLANCTTAEEGKYKIQNCSDGSTINTSQCISGKWVELTSLCPTNDTYNNATNITTCWQNSELIEQSIFGNKSCSMINLSGNVDCFTNGHYDTEKECEDALDIGLIYILIGVGVGVVIIVIIIVVLMNRRPRGRRYR